MPELGLAELLAPAETTLVLWDLQNGLAGQSPQVAELSVVWRELRDAARAAGVLISRSQHIAPRPDVMDQVERWRISRRTHGENQPERYMQPGGHDTAYLEGFEPAADELVITKSAPSLFFDTPADRRFKAYGVRTVVLAGVATDIGIDFTARHAMALGYFPIVVEDGVGAFGPAAHEHAMAILRSFTLVASSAEIRSHWEGA